MTDRKKSIDRAMRQAKRYYGKQCVVCGFDTVEGAHIFPRGMIKYKHLAEVTYNVVTLCQYHHTSMDNYNEYRKRNPWSRVKYLILNVDDSMFKKFTHAIFELRKKI